MAASYSHSQRRTSAHVRANKATVIARYTKTFIVPLRRTLTPALSVYARTGSRRAQDRRLRRHTHVAEGHRGGVKLDRGRSALSGSTMSAPALAERRQPG